MAGGVGVAGGVGLAGGVGVAGGVGLLELKGATLFLFTLCIQSPWLLSS